MISSIEVCEWLGQAGIEVEPDTMRLEAREERWMVQLPGDRLLWIAMSEKGREKLRVERNVLRSLAAHCTFAVPRVLYESADGRFEVRSKVPGVVDPWRFYDLIQTDAAFAIRTGQALGKMLAEQHTRIERSMVADGLPDALEFPIPVDVMRDRIPQVVQDAGLLADIEVVLRQYEALQVDASDGVLVHADIGFHNLAFDPETLTVQGIFDYGEAAWVDRHHDFRYFVFDFDCQNLLEAAIAVYEPAVGVKLSRSRIYLYNAVCALSFLAYRLGTPDDEKSCGRTLAQDLKWTRWAIGQIERF